MRHSRFAWMIVLFVSFAFAGAEAGQVGEGKPQAWRAMLEKDAAETVGHWIELELLQRKLEHLRLDDDAKTLEVEWKARPFEWDARWSEGRVQFAAWIGGVSSAAGSGLLLLDMGDDTSLGSGGSGGSGGNSLRVSVSGGAIGLSSGGVSIWMEYQGPDENSSTFYQYSSSDLKRFGSSSFGSGRERAREVDGVNAARRASFESMLETTAQRIADRLASLLGIPASARLEFGRALERKLRAGFAAGKDAKTEINVVSILRSVMADADQRVALLHRMVREAAREKMQVRTAAEGVAAYDALLREIQDLHAKAIDSQRVSGAHANGHIAALARSFERFAADQEVFLEEMKLRQRLVR